MTVLCSPTWQNPFLVFRHSLFKSNTQDISQDNLLCAAENEKQGHWRGECTKYLTLQLSQPHTGTIIQAETLPIPAAAKTPVNCSCSPGEGSSFIPAEGPHCQVQDHWLSSGLIVTRTNFDQDCTQGCHPADLRFAELCWSKEQRERALASKSSRFTRPTRRAGQAQHLRLLPSVNLQSSGSKRP